MKISFNWLKDYVHLAEDVTPEQVGDKLTFSGNELEGVEKQGAGLEQVFVGEILEIAPHPDADRLQVTKTITSPGGEPLQIVCGARNIKVGQRIPVAVIGASLPNGLAIKASKIRGVPSQGMLCSAEELHLQVEQKEEGIFVLPEDAPVGENFATYMGFDDTILDISVTPNRGDVLSHIGMGREVAAVYQTKVRIPDFKTPATRQNSGNVSIANEVGDDCPLYLGQLVEGVKVAPSPPWLKAKIESVGLRSINNVVDITSFVMFEVGQPLHAFDADLLRESGEIQIKIRNGKKEDVFHSISHEKHQLTENDIVIAAGKEGQIPAALAGVMGAADTEVSEKTVNVLLESAVFSQARVRKTAKRTNIQSDASYRFERQVDQSKVRWALDRAASLLVEIAGGQAFEPVVCETKALVSPADIALSLSRMRAFLSLDLTESEVIGILHRLGFCVEKLAEDKLQVFVPPHRHDIELAEDVMEEIARVHGYANIPARLPVGMFKEVKQAAQHLEEKNKIRENLTASGFFEAVNFSFSNRNILGNFYEVTDADEIDNPVSQDFTHLKRSLLPGLWENVLFNVKHQYKDLRFFEIRKVFFPDQSRVDEKLDTGYREHTSLALMATGSVLDEHWSSFNHSYDFFELKGALENCFGVLRRKGLQFGKKEAPSYFHPGQTASLRLGKAAIGFIGRLHPRLEKEVGQPIFAAEINLDDALEQRSAKLKYKHFSKSPRVERDFSCVIANSVAGTDILQAVQKVGKPYVTNAFFFDSYTGDRVPEGHVSYAFRVVLDSGERTLTDKEIHEVQDKIMSKLEADFSATFAGRSK